MCSKIATNLEAEQADCSSLNLDFMIIGAGKSGTTSLYGYLLRHPGVFLPELKEPEFFSRSEVYQRGMQWYASLFGDAPPGVLRGEASTTYSRWPHTLDAPQLIQEHTTTRKFIYLVREPVARAYSHYRHHMRGKVTMTFEEALQRDEIYFDCGDYMMQIDRYLRYFEAGDLLVIQNEHLQKEPQDTLAKVQSFLGLEERDLTAAGEERRNLGEDDYALRYKAKRLMQSLPGAMALKSRIPQSWRTAVFDRLRRTRFAAQVREENQPSPLLPETKKALSARYEPSVRRLEAFLQRDLSHWRCH